ncbi:penicillin-binding protein 2 [Patescibacteria group bacterium]|nr:penicillin-binding protein 2 [Patescibacteria group bacterium]MBU2472594.1 penicillin-binding protein 2 [Patescibacteria group bacterium]
MELKKYFIKNKGQEDIEAEEIFLDAEAIRSLEEKGKLENPIKNRNFILFYALIIVCLFALFLRAGYFQVVKGNYYYDLSQGNRLRIYSTAAPRGIIYDSSGQPLVYNIPSFDLVVNVVDFLDNPDLVQEKILREIANIFRDENQEESISILYNDELIIGFREKIGKAKGQVSQVVLIRGIERSLALILETLINDWPGLRMEKNTQRQYISGLYFSHILGYTGEVDRSDLKSYSDYSLGDKIGKIGLEYQYEDILKGKPGQEQIEVDSLGKTQKLLADKPSQPGQGLVLFINQGLQEKLYQSLEQIPKSVKGTRKAVALAVNPNNGGVMALVSLPSFDNNLFAQGISQEDLESLENSSNYPFLNRALSGQYPPGSIIKPLIAAAALEEKIITPKETINCQGGLSIVNKYNPEIVYYYPDWKTHGLIDIVKAIAESCNTFFYALGGGYDKIEGLGVDKIKTYLQNFGLGNITQIDLPNEEAGLIPDKEWKEDWYLGDTYHLSIGQGDILVTPIQMAMAIAAIANDGILYQPQLVDKIIDLNGNIREDIPIKVVRSNFIQLDNLEIVQKGMREAVLSGSAQALSNLSVKVAGKTGTAQFGTKEQTHAWFVGFAPYDNPEIVIVVLVEGGGEGHSAAVPVAKEALEWYFNQ